MTTTKERKRNENENKLENKDEDEQKVKRRRLSEACDLLTEENVLLSGVALRVNKIDDGMLKELRTLHKGLEACEQSCMPAKTLGRRFNVGERFISSRRVFD